MRKRSRPADEASIDMTPMLDVVFILLIFFIVTSTFLNEVGFDLTPPPQDPNAPPSRVKAVNVVIDQSNLVTMDGRVTDLGSVRANIERRKAENPDISVVIAASGLAKNQIVIEVYDQAKMTGVMNVNLVETAE